ncbi:hypothetical protein MBT84_04630 [Streptomyces sp. MBT84]|uniref:hypothetical protein n=1 Tax=unclassified Streptomyces TaxID=2593676 RepID=UPI001C6DF4FA|nr:hypothetical protein [Streptomyces sp. MBT84]MBW8698862.1 hypothetical protein [Streptomyces sp. MBT84]
MTDQPEQELELTSALVPLFLITNGRALPPDHAYERTTLISAQVDDPAAARTLSPEARRLFPAARRPAGAGERDGNCVVPAMITG